MRRKLNVSDDQMNKKVKRNRITGPKPWVNNCGCGWMRESVLIVCNPHAPKLANYFFLEPLFMSWLIIYNAQLTMQQSKMVYRTINVSWLMIHQMSIIHFRIIHLYLISFCHNLLVAFAFIIISENHANAHHSALAYETGWTQSIWNVLFLLRPTHEMGLWPCSMLQMRESLIYNSLTWIEALTEFTSLPNRSNRFTEYKFWMEFNRYISLYRSPPHSIETIQLNKLF